VSRQNDPMPRRLPALVVRVELEAEPHCWIDADAESAEARLRTWLADQRVRRRIVAEVELALKGLNARRAV
jgi:hypothetical protein